MCGIAGLYNSRNESPDPDRVRQMLSQIQYRGPDESGVFTGRGIGLGSIRLSIIDLALGQQPMTTAEGDLWIVYNGEIFNYVELRQDLERLGYRFRTRSDTEVLLLLFRHYREKCLPMLNGQFAFAVWDPRRRELFLARDRMGIRPLFYHSEGGQFAFASEIKCLFEAEGIRPELDPVNLDRAFTFWTIPSPGTLFRGVYELPPGHYMFRSGEKEEIAPYWDLDFRSAREALGSLDFGEKLEQLEALVSDSVRLRLRADVQVAAYLILLLTYPLTSTPFAMPEP